MAVRASVALTPAFLAGGGPSQQGPWSWGEERTPNQPVPCGRATWAGLREQAGSPAPVLSHPPRPHPGQTIPGGDLQPQLLPFKSSVYT